MWDHRYLGLRCGIPVLEDLLDDLFVKPLSVDPLILVDDSVVCGYEVVDGDLLLGD